MTATSAATGALPSCHRRCHATFGVIEHVKILRKSGVKSKCFIKGKSMDILDRFEIYIPKEAEVKNIPLWSLSNLVLRRLGLPQSDCEGSRDLAASPECTWISPAVLRERGRPTASHTGDAAKESVSSLFGRKLQTAQGPFQMPFVSSNPTAYRVLGETLHGKRVSTQIGHGSPPRAHQDAVIIYHGHIYLSMKKLKQVRNQGETPEPKPVAWSVLSGSPLLETSAFASGSQNTRRSSRSVHKVAVADTVLQNKTRLLKRRCLASQLQIILPKMTPEELKGQYAKAAPCSTREMSVPDQELFSDCGSKKKHDMCKDEGDGAMPAWGGEEEEEEVVVVAPTSSGESDMEDGGCQEAASDVQSWTKGGLLGLAFASRPVPQDFDFEQLAKEEMISRIRARLRESEAAVKNLQSSK